MGQPDGKLAKAGSKVRSDSWMGLQGLLPQHACLSSSALCMLPSLLVIVAASDCRRSLLQALHRWSALSLVRACALIWSPVGYGCWRSDNSLQSACAPGGSAVQGQAGQHRQGLRRNQGPEDLQVPTGCALCPLASLQPGGHARCFTILGSAFCLVLCSGHHRAWNRDIAGPGKLAPKAPLLRVWPRQMANACMRGCGLLRRHG